MPAVQEWLQGGGVLLAWGGGLEPERLLAAYRRGIFPWYAEGQPILWWSPAPRCVIQPDRVYLSRRTRRRYNSGCYRLTLNTAFADVIAGCAQPRDGDDGHRLPDHPGAHGLDRVGHGLAGRDHHHALARQPQQCALLRQVLHGSDKL